MSGFDAFPVELLLEVFAYLPEVDPDAPLRVGALNRHWRNVVQGWPALWTSLRLSRHEPKRKGALWFERSQKHIEHLFVTDCTAFATFNEETSLNCFTLGDIFTFLGVDFMQSPGTVMDTLDGLRGLHVALDGAAFIINSECILRLLRLRHLDLQVTTVSFQSAVPSMNQLRSLQLCTSVLFGPHYSLKVAEAVTILVRDNASFQHLKIHDPLAAPSRTPEMVVAPIHLPALVSIDLMGPVHNTPVLNALRVPALRRLSLDYQNTRDVLRRLRPSDLANVRELCLTHICDNPTYLLPLICGMSRLTILRLDRCAWNVNALVEGLTSLPLEEVTFSHCARLAGSPIQSLVKARHADGARLHTVTVEDCPLVSPEVLEWLKDQGCVVRGR